MGRLADTPRADIEDFLFLEAELLVVPIRKERRLIINGKMATIGATRKPQVGNCREIDSIREANHSRIVQTDALHIPLELQYLQLRPLSVAVQNGNQDQVRVAAYRPLCDPH